MAKHKKDGVRAVQKPKSACACRQGSWKPIFGSGLMIVGYVC